jgi:hypothetical protein
MATQIYSRFLLAAARLEGAVARLPGAADKRCGQEESLFVDPDRVPDVRGKAHLVNGSLRGRYAEQPQPSSDLS